MVWVRALKKVGRVGTHFFVQIFLSKCIKLYFFSRKPDFFSRFHQYIKVGSGYRYFCIWPYYKLVIVLFQRLAKHVMNVHLNALQMTEEPAEGEIDLMTLKKYISYCRT